MASISLRNSRNTPRKGVFLLRTLCIARSEGKVGITFLDAGEIKLKHIDQPLHTWRWVVNGNALPAMHAADHSRPVIADRPSIAVLPFSVMSSDPEQEFFADGLVEDILATILRSCPGFPSSHAVRALFTRAAPSTCAKLPASSGVHFVLEGSVRKIGGRIRVTVQLINATTGYLSGRSLRSQP